MGSSAMNHEQKTFYVTNRGVAALLVTQGYEILSFSKGKTRDGHEQLRINFESTTSLRETIDEYFNGTAMVSARAYNEAMRDLNMRIRNEVK